MGIRGGISRFTVRITRSRVLLLGGDLVRIWCLMLGAGMGFGHCLFDDLMIDECIYT
jgi:hypothetical protein